MTDFAQTVKQQADIVKVIEQYIRLRKAGGVNYQGLCPFHKEKSPSFSVHQVRQFFHCFGCGVSGDVFSFVGKIENVSFPEAVRIVAGKAGIPLPKKEYSSPEEAAEARTRRKLLDLHEAAAAFFEEQLRGPEGAVAREYLTGRGLNADGIKLFRIGYSPDSFNVLRDRLSSLADAETLRASGLFSSKEHEDGTQGPLYDRFRKRVMFPICSESGRVIAFTARTLESGDKAGPKYINSPETPLYSKGQVLFNLDKARTAMRQAEFALLVEGQMDCISVFLRGIQNVIATSGTAFTEHQVALLRRHTSNVAVNFDPDTAGANAAEKSIALLTEEGFTIKIVTLEDGLDPDRYIRERGVEAYTKAIRGARRQADYLIERARQLFPGASAEQKVKAMNYLLPHIRRMPEKLARDQFAHDAAQRLGIDSAVLREELRQAALKRRDHIDVKTATISAAEKVLIRSLASSATAGVEQRQAISSALRNHPDWFQSLTTVSALLELSRVESHGDPIEAITDPTLKSQVAGILIEADRLPYDVKGRAVGFQTGRIPSLSEITQILEGLQEVTIEQSLRQLLTQIAEAQRNGDFLEVAALGQKKVEMDRALRQLRKQRHNEGESDHTPG